ncbi:MAG: Tol-Pal system protein TolB, partial [Candidatus Thiodiazotropha sp.]
MKRFLFSLILFFTWQPALFAELTIEITEGVEGALPIAVVPFSWQGKGAPPVDIAEVISADLQRSGRFKSLPREDMLARPTSVDLVEFKDWRALGIENLVVGQVQAHGAGGYQIQFQLLDVFRGEQLTGYSIPTTAPNLRNTAHRIADLIYEKLLGVPGAFATRVAYITSTKLAEGESSIKLKIGNPVGGVAQIGC